MPSTKKLHSEALVLRLSPKLNKALDAMVKETGMSRSEILRCLICKQAGFPLADALPMKWGRMKKKGGKK